MADAQKNWHAMDVAATAQALGTDVTVGLAPHEAALRLATYGPNALPEEKKKTLLGMFLGQFKDFLVLILVAAAAVSLAVQEVTDAIVIIAILVINATLGVIQEHRAGRALEALKKLSVPETEVIRGGQTERISSEALVSGDLVVLREGSFVPADIRLIESHNLRIDEASLTGESEPVEKSCEAIAPDSPLAERRNMAYAGTVVTYGRGRGLVVATGVEREIGRIAQLIEQGKEEMTPLQRRLAGFGKLLGILTLAICALTFVLGVARGEPVLRMFLTAVSLAVAAIPEGLPAIITVVLALGVHQMSRHRAIVRKLPAVETLGCATYICTDKTGTLTENRMVVTKVAPSDALSAEAGQAEAGETQEAGSASPSAAWKHLVEVAVLCNDSHVEVVDNHQRRFGDPTELALVEFAEAEGISAADLRKKHPRLAEVPFDSQRKRMSTLHDFDGARRLLVKGAPDILMGLCRWYETDGGVAPFGPAEQARAHAELESMADQALRVLALAWKNMPPGTSHVKADDERDLVLAGLVGMRDSPRSEARAALAEAKAAGIRTIMITGDNLRTARTIAAELGMMEPGDEAMTGQDLAQIPDEDLVRRIEHLRVFARVWPEQKMKIVQALQAAGEVVAMTGDGVNDAPALQKSDIGVAMGITGTDVAKGAADVVLTDDNFATIVEAIKQGRVIFDNIRKFITYLLACNLGEILTVFVPVLAGLSSPLIPVQILLINLVTDGLPALSLGVDCPEPDVMRRRPRRSTEGILDRRYMQIIVVNALFIAAAVITSYLAGLRMADVETAETMAFVTLGFAELLRAYSSRSERRSIWQIDPRTNPYILGACALSAAIIVATVVVPPVREVCGNVLLSGRQWAVSLALCVIPTAAYETWKVAARLAGRW